MKFSRIVLFSALVIVLVGCTNSEWLLSALYNRMDNILATEVKEYADFTKEQSQEIDLLADQYHLWHRTNHLPRYASLLREIDAQIHSGEIADRAQIEHWSMTIEGYAREMADCYPLSSAYNLLRSLTDEQVDQVLAHGIKEYDDFVEDRVDMTEEKRIDMRYDETRKWLGRIQLDLNSDQRDKLRKTIASERTVGGAGVELWKNWHEAFVEILRDRHQEGFERRISGHVEKLWTLQDDNFPDAVDFNRTLWIDYFSELAQSQTDDQRADFSRWLAKMAKNLEGIAANLSPANQNLLVLEMGSCRSPTELQSAKSS